MIVTRLSGGLGNQMFQYAVGRHLSFNHKTSLKFDLTLLNQKTTDTTYRKYSLDFFGITGEAASSQEIKSVKGQLYPFLIRKANNYFQKFRPYYHQKVIRERNFSFDHNILRAPSNCYLEGYWQSEKYFANIADIIRKDFSLKMTLSEKNLSIVHHMRACDSVSMHIRRSDYVYNPEINRVHGICSSEYYRKAVSYLQDRMGNISLFIFSDDISWVKNNLHFEVPVTYITNNTETPVFDMVLMSKCQHHIIANSSFSWWGAWLNPNIDKIVIAPEKWFMTTDRDTKDILPTSWIKL